MRKSTLVSLVLPLVLIVGQGSLSASWLSDVTGVDVNVAEGTVHVDPPTPQEIPRRIQHAIETLPGAIEGAARDIFNPAGAGLAAAIRHARAQALHGARPIPQAIREQLAGIVPDQILNDVQWNSLDSNRIDLANLTLLHNNDTAAITVGNVIVFDRLEDAAANWYLWSHELMHTIQYGGMGIEGFAHAYVLSSSDLESQAENYSNMVAQRVRDRNAGNGYRPIQYRGATATVLSDATFSSIQTAVRRTLPATGCLDIQDNGGQPTVTNVCNTPVWVSTFVEVDRSTGQRIPGRCYPSPGIVCEIRPNQILPVYTPRGGCIEQVSFSFFSDGYNSEEGTWEGDCRDVVVVRPPQVGQSCCMFSGGRCGPFTNQPAYPLGSPCSCQYGNPYANGEVCRP